MRIEQRQDPDAVAELIADLSDWFELPEENRALVAKAHRLPSVVAVADTAVVGAAMWQRHFPEAAEVSFLAVSRSRHRRGIGSALLAHCESVLAADGVRLLQVKTLGPSYPDRGYANTRAFYRACGYLPLEELLDFWPGNPCLIQVKALG